MKKKCSLVSVSESELQIRGGTAWRGLFKIVRYMKFIVDFISEYKEDISRGFEKGWKSV